MSYFFQEEIIIYIFPSIVITCLNCLIWSWGSRLISDNNKAVTSVNIDLGVFLAFCFRNTFHWSRSMLSGLELWCPNCNRSNDNLSHSFDNQRTLLGIARKIESFIYTETHFPSSSVLNPQGGLIMGVNAPPSYSPEKWHYLKCYVTNFVSKHCSL